MIWHTLRRSFLRRTSGTTRRTMVREPSLLILCFSDLSRDPRVRKQIRYFKDGYRVTTCGFGPPPDPEVRHAEVSREVPKPLELLRAAFIRLHWYRLAYWTTPAVREAERKLRGKHFDVVLANDLDTAGVAEAIVPASRVHMDIHEYWPGLHDHRPEWVKLRKPYYEWMLRHYVARAASLTVVNSTTSERYEDEFGFASQVVPNAAPFYDLHPSPVGRPLRAVYAGGPNPERRIDDLIRAGAAAKGVSLDLYLVGGETPHYLELKDLAEKLGNGVRVLPAVPANELINTLNGYDIGFHSLPPTNTNHLVTMPNKYYEYIQARLALVLGPSPTMKREARGFDGAAVASGFSAEELGLALESLSVSDVIRMKNASHQVAASLAAENYNHIWGDAIERIARRP